MARPPRLKLPRPPRTCAGFDPASFTCTSCGEQTDFPSEAGRCVTCEPVPIEVDPAAPEHLTAKFLHARPLGEWLQATGRQEKLGAISKHYADRISKWVSRGGRASEKTVDEMLIRLGEHPRAVPAEFWITEPAPVPVAQLDVFGTREELADLMAAA